MRVTVQKMLAQKLGDAISSKHLAQLESAVQHAEAANFSWNDNLAVAKTMISDLKKPSIVITLHTRRRDDDGVSNAVQCTNISGSELATFNVNQCKTLGTLRSLLAIRLDLPMERLRLVLADGGFLPASVDAAPLFRLTSSAADMDSLAHDGWSPVSCCGLSRRLQSSCEIPMQACYPFLRAVFRIRR